MKLSAHFTLEELCKSETAIRYGLINVPQIGTADGNRIIAAMQKMAKQILEPIRKQYGPYSPSSGYRAPQVNRLLGSSNESQHVKGEAVDIPPPLGVELDDFAQWCWKHLPFDQLIVERDKGREWLHISHNPHGQQRRQALQKTNGGAYLPWRPKG